MSEKIERPSAPSAILRARSDVKRDPRARPTIGDRFATDDGYIVEIIGMGTRHYLPFFRVRQFPGAKRCAKEGEDREAWRKRETVERSVLWEHWSGRDLRSLLAKLRVLDPFDPA